MYLHVLHCKISSIMPLELPTAELHFCEEGFSWPLSRALFTRGGIKLWTIQNYKAEMVSFGLKSIVDFPSSLIHKWERFGPGLFWCITIFFKVSRDTFHFP